MAFFKVRFLRNKVPFIKWAKCMFTPSPELSKLIWSWRPPSYPCEIMYHARKAAAARCISTLTNRGEGGRRYLTNAFPSGTLFRRNRNKTKRWVFIIHTTVAVAIMDGIKIIPLFDCHHHPIDRNNIRYSDCWLLPYKSQ